MNEQDYEELDEMAIEDLLKENDELKHKLQIAMEALEDIVLNGVNIFATYRANEVLGRIKE